MAYAGRVGVKFEAAAKAGAAGVLVIHEEAAASYPFSQLANGDALPAFVLAPLNPSPLKLSGWIAGEVAQDLLKRSKLSLPALKTRARDPGFRAFPLEGASLTAAGDLKVTPLVSRNVIAKITGATRPNEFILYGAHWDANGNTAPDKSGDAIRNGAVDNATGTAEVLELARAFKAAAHPRARSSSPPGPRKRKVCSAPTTTRRTRSIRSPRPRRSSTSIRTLSFPPRVTWS
jgi:Zn-dependent M28 family amino/carboxypeptidase